MNSIAIVYWNGNEKTETIGRMIARGAADSGVLVTIFTAEEFKPSRMASFNAVAFGCPTVGDEESYSFDAYLDELGEHLHEAPVAVFGSYEDAGDAVDVWEESMVNRGVELVSAIKLDNFPRAPKWSAAWRWVPSWGPLPRARSSTPTRKPRWRSPKP